LIAQRDTKFVSTERVTPATLRRRVHEALCAVLIAGNVGFGIVGLVMPQRIGALIDEPEDAVKRIARKDLAAGLALASSRKRPVVPLTLNALADAKEAAGWFKTKPLLAMVPLLWAAIAVVALLTRGQDEAS
jgi:hypothetical protein